MNKLKVGIIGYGGFGRFLHRCWETVSQVEVVAVSKRSLPPGSLGPVQVYNDWRELIAQPEISLVVIATPPAQHMEMACAAMEAGKHVLIEKPLATSLEDGQKILSVRDQTGMVAGINHLLRFNPIIKAIIALTKEGVFGPLRRADVENYAGDEGLPPDHWFWDHSVSGGIIIEHGVHFFDIINQLTTEKPRKISAFGYWRNRVQEDRVVINILYSEGLIATHYHLFARPSDFESTTVRLAYDLAQFDISGWVPLEGRITALLEADKLAKLNRLPNLEIQDIQSLKGRSKVSATFSLPKPKQAVYADCARSLLLDLIQKINNPQHRLEVPLEDGLAALEIAQMAAAY
ncbi:MAG: Gfo/Idh/MocA family oxidoreductase, partial [Firmicutes bacterium]|nr:Gfo/Idh/MocA family oxidoreductase [Bacillota bacterium]